MTTLNDRLDSIESTLNTIYLKADDIPTEAETEASRKEIFLEIEDFQTRVNSIELQVSMLKKVINSA